MGTERCFRRGMRVFSVGSGSVYGFRRRGGRLSGTFRGFCGSRRVAGCWGRNSTFGRGGNGSVGRGGFGFGQLDLLRRVGFDRVEFVPVSRAVDRSGGVNIGLKDDLCIVELGILLVSVKIVWMIHKQTKVEHFQFWILNSIEFRLNDLSNRLRSIERNTAPSRDTDT